MFRSVAVVAALVVCLAAAASAVCGRKKCGDNCRTVAELGRPWQSGYCQGARVTDCVRAVRAIGASPVHPRVFAPRRRTAHGRRQQRPCAALRPRSQFVPCARRCARDTRHGTLSRRCRCRRLPFALLPPGDGKWAACGTYKVCPSALPPTLRARACGSRHVYAREMAPATQARRCTTRKAAARARSRWLTIASRARARSLALSLRLPPAPRVWAGCRRSPTCATTVTPRTTRPTGS